MSKSLEIATASWLPSRRPKRSCCCRPTNAIPILFVGGEGVHLIDEQGNRYLDLLSGIGVNALGYAHPAIEEAIAEQSKKLLHISNLFFHTGQAELAARLTEMTGMDRVFFSNSGTEAWEAALKLARLYAGTRRSKGAQIGTKFLALDHSFHGRTMGSVATTEKEKYREPFMPVMPGVEFVPFNDVAALRAAFSNEYLRHLHRSRAGRGRHPSGLAGVPRRGARADALDRRTAHHRRDPGRSRPHRQMVRVSALRRPAGHHHAGQAARRRPAAGRDALHRRSRERDAARTARHHIRRRPAGMRRRHRRDRHAEARRRCSRTFRTWAATSARSSLAWRRSTPPSSPARVAWA